MENRSETASATILVIEDDPVFRGILVEFIGTEGGYQVVAVDRGTDALAAYFANRPDAVLLDISLPDMDGLALLRRLFLLEERTPVLVLTGLLDESLEGRCLELGATAVLRKPVRLQVLQEAFTRLLAS